MQSKKLTLRMTYEGSSLPIVLMYCATEPSKSPLLQTQPLNTCNMHWTNIKQRKTQSKQPIHTSLRVY